MFRFGSNVFWRTFDVKGTPKRATRRPNGHPSGPNWSETRSKRAHKELAQKREEEEAAKKKKAEQKKKKTAKKVTEEAGAQQRVLALSRGC